MEHSLIELKVGMKLRGFAVVSHLSDTEIVSLGLGREAKRVISCRRPAWTDDRKAAPELERQLLTLTTTAATNRVDWSVDGALGHEPWRCSLRFGQPSLNTSTARLQVWVLSRVGQTSRAPSTSLDETVIDRSSPIEMRFRENAMLRLAFLLSFLSCLPAPWSSHLTALVN